jgi:hypothetical protein
MTVWHGLRPPPSMSAHTCATLNVTVARQVAPRAYRNKISAPQKRRGHRTGAISQGLAARVATMGSGFSHAMRLSVLLGMGAAALALGGCGVADRVYTPGFWVEPGKYDFLKCPDLARESVAASNREQQLLSLMDRANQDPAGAVINLTVYRTDLEQVRAQLDLLNRTAREKGCDSLVPTKK